MTEPVTEPVVSKPRRPIRIADINSFVNENESIVVKNTLNTIAILVIKVDGAEEQCEFKAAGDPHGEDIMEVPSTYLKNAQFRKQLQLGIFKIVDADNPDVLDAMENQLKAWEAAQVAKAETDRFIEAQQPRAYSGVQCLAQEGRQQCVDYAIYAQNNRERPPLCQKHAHLATQFTPEETGTFTDGKPDIRWNRVVVQGGR